MPASDKSTSICSNLGLSKTWLFIKAHAFSTICIAVSSTTCLGGLRLLIFVGMASPKVQVISNGRSRKALVVISHESPNLPTRSRC